MNLSCFNSLVKIKKTLLLLGILTAKIIKFSKELHRVLVTRKIVHVQIITGIVCNKVKIKPL